MQDRLYDMLVKEDEITWQSIIYDLIKSEEMDPWDIDIKVLTKRYIETIKELKETNFFISGKILLAAALLLRLKSYKLVDVDLANFDSILYEQEELFDDLDHEDLRIEEDQIPELAIKTPQARKRRVNVNDLIKALQKALRVSDRKRIRMEREENFPVPEIPIRKVDIGELMKEVYERILNFFSKKEKVSFTELVNSEEKEDKILTFIPLLHLDNQGKVDLRQEEHFGEIHIHNVKL